MAEDEYDHYDLLQLAQTATKAETTANVRPNGFPLSGLQSPCSCWERLAVSVAETSERSLFDAISGRP